MFVNSNLSPAVQVWSLQGSGAGVCEGGPDAEGEGQSDQAG